MRKKPKKDKKKVEKKKDETMADGSSRHERDGTAGAVAGAGCSGDSGRGEETLPGAKKYFQPLAFNY
ncbi:hypothetical protein PUN28_004737 [Cardiocondyla obscurior]|uniref:Uncharacterized protein n=1 Tax=Cardiocondyla obscurior TaxID=286306 RepID=A0AAW2GGB8_9HYME